MIQVNLIPDLKAEFLRAQKIKRLVIGVSTIVTIVFVGLVTGMFVYVNVVQKNHTNNLSADIETLTKDYVGGGDVDKIVSVQRQLQALPGLLATKPEISRTVSYLSVLTPDGIEYRNYSLDLELETMTIDGTAEEVPDVNTFIDSIKNAEYRIGDGKDRFPAFSNVVLESISTRDDDTRFSISMSFDSTIFVSPENVRLSVPEINSTQSEQARPKTSTNSPADDARENDIFEGEN